jgi:hypothetical protein
MVGYTAACHRAAPCADPVGYPTLRAAALRDAPRKRNLETRVRQNNPTGNIPLNPSGKSAL